VKEVPLQLADCSRVDALHGGSRGPHGGNLHPEGGLSTSAEKNVEVVNSLDQSRDGSEGRARDCLP
jgi:hypothetical protein